MSSIWLFKNLNIKIYRTIILPVVFYGCETWSLTLREESRLGVFENTVLRRIFGSRRDEVTVEWRRLHNEELNDLYCFLPNIVRVIKSSRMRWAGHVARMGERRDVYRVLVGKLEGNRPLRRPRRRWEDNINPLAPNDPYRGRTAPLTSKRCILYIYSTNTGTEYFKHGIYSPFFPLQNAVSTVFGSCIIHILYTECAKI